MIDRFQYLAKQMNSELSGKNVAFLNLDYGGDQDYMKLDDFLEFNHIEVNSEEMRRKVRGEYRSFIRPLRQTLSDFKKAARKNNFDLENCDSLVCFDDSIKTGQSILGGYRRALQICDYFGIPYAYIGTSLDKIGIAHFAPKREIVANGSQYSRTWRYVGFKRFLKEFSPVLYSEFLTKGWMEKVPNHHPGLWDLRSPDFGDLATSIDWVNLDCELGSVTDQVTNMWVNSRNFINSLTYLYRSIDDFLILNLKRDQPERDVFQVFQNVLLLSLERQRSDREVLQSKDWFFFERGYNETVRTTNNLNILDDPKFQSLLSEGPKLLLFDYISCKEDLKPKIKHLMDRGLLQSFTYVDATDDRAHQVRALSLD